VDLKSVFANQLFDTAMATDRVPLAIFNMQSFMPDPKEMMELAFASRPEAMLNLARYAKPEVDQLIDEASAETSWASRYRLYQQIEEIIVADAPFVFLGHQNLFSLSQPRLKGPLIETSWPFRLDRVWLDQ
jgi:ABC-type transport system substrate-binding protein